ncbi:MAG: methylenetetrahydrofolate--tRNA-(uracil(54)-C(5))-methyltransferase (FADH(2)-oxidizing) TrmFO [Pelagibacterales bacterium]|nr:methylenetetrahydrofolate--tRNA-(uracil(54)-C(5))-methyltransferase (FADH(2)-oxidizing) TrmFO [Pelagibacterales bacterium]OUV28115.1 MAG: methylenetetrahydrofolate--tRNA-(uracil(54)-C(5))-methyltransferase (FADH(2)-oxidizing) TrmFO [Alphaproteobacteria bacterium TMED109]RCL83243.1 MAG: methylenetetrahydrofolate--tRNA-(uracil(54)-C(5))-methyltransferase (FADH(2)-oxidizing) TrmFO [Alphaproteobacteria bacterium]|tara:strand:- start:3949 stop:5313 length:1365 start_codon:yes stop_codon:yes gene_type:complete
MNKNKIVVIGGGLAGCEAAWQLASLGFEVDLYEMRPKVKTEAHISDNLAELVCSNSFRSDDMNNNAVGLLHAEMRELNSLIISCADKNKIPAGGALAVDREQFSQSVHKIILEHPLINIIHKEYKNLPDFSKKAIIASGPLTSKSLTQNIIKSTGNENLAFFDAIAPIVYSDSINMDIAWLQSRYDKIGTLGDEAAYINCPLNKAEYINFVNKLKNAEYTEFKEWEKNTPYFESCLPIEVIANRGIDTLRFGPMKPIGLTNKHSNIKPYAVVQLRQDNASATLYNIVGFQTKMKYNEQVDIFKSIPGLENAKFARLGGLHRNTFINSPLILDKQLRYKKLPNIRFAGQITGVEGYVESAAMGLLAGRFLAYEELNKKDIDIPYSTALGSLISHVTTIRDKNLFQPMNINYGLIPKVIVKKYKNKKEKKEISRKNIATKAIKEIKLWQNNFNTKL